MAQGNWQFLHRSEEYIFYYRRAIPQLLRPAFDNKWEIKRSLKTRDKSIAIIRHNEINVNIERIFLQARKGEVMSKDLSSMLAQLKDRKQFIGEVENHPLETILSGISVVLRGKPILGDDGEVITPATISVKENGELQDDDGKTIPKHTVSWALGIAEKQGIQELSHDLEALASSGKKHSGFFFDAEKGRANAFSPPHVNRLIEEQETKTKRLEPPQPSNKANGLEPKRDDGLTPIIFSTLTEEYHHARSGLKAKTIMDNKSVYSVFIELMGDVLSTDITHAMISEFRKKLQTLPSNFRKKYPDVSAKEFRDMNIPIDELMTPTTVNKYISRMSQVLKWATSEGHMEQNYASGKNVLLSRKEKKKVKRFPFDDNDLDKIFMRSPIHKENLREGKKLEMFWVPLIALYSGMRLEEICQLQISDVREIEDEANDTGQMIWCFDVNEDGYNKSVKNMPSERIVPIHSELIKMGLLDYFQERQSKGYQTLWNLEPAKSGNITRGYSHNFGKRLRPYIKLKAGVADEGKTFHSFRHTAIQSLRNNRDVREDYLKALVGHELSGTTGTDYFSGLGVSLLKDTVEGIRYPKLDLSCLYTAD